MFLMSYKNDYRCKMGMDWLRVSKENFPMELRQRIHLLTKSSHLRKQFFTETFIKKNIDLQFP